jgi:hypothetical protein
MHFTPKELEKLKQVHEGNNPTFLTYEEIWKNHFPAMAAELKRLWALEEGVTPEEEKEFYRKAYHSCNTGCANPCKDRI